MNEHQMIGAVSVTVLVNGQFQLGQIGAAALGSDLSSGFAWGFAWEHSEYLSIMSYHLPPRGPSPLHILRDLRDRPFVLHAGGVGNPERDGILISRDELHLAFEGLGIIGPATFEAVTVPEHLAEYPEWQSGVQSAAWRDGVRTALAAVRGLAGS